MPTEKIDRRAARHAATRQEIVDAAWENVRERGIADLSLRDVAAAVGMQPPSLYVYFDSKDAVYDAMFAQAANDMLECLRAVRWPRDKRRTGLLRKAEATFDFLTTDHVRFQLVFERSVPGFNPSAESYAPAIAALELTRTQLAEAGATGPEAADIWTALMTGLASQQIANDPGGARWRDLLPGVVEMYADHMGIGD